MSTLSQEDRASLGDSLRKVLQDSYEFTAGRRQDLTVGPGEMPPIWDRLVELGLTSLLVPEAHGGFGAGVADLQRVQGELGRALVVSPWLGTALGTLLITQAATSVQQAAWLPALAEGSLSVALVLPPAWDLQAQGIHARWKNDGWRLEGRASTVLHAAVVDRYLVCAELPTGGEAWFAVEAKAAGITRHDHRLVDHAWAAEVVFADAPAERLGGDMPAAQQAKIISQLQAARVAAHSAEALQVAQAGLDATVQYLRTRKQFGQALGDYQALRHRVAEMYIGLEQARSAAELAREATELEDTAAQARLAAQAQLISAETTTWILQQSIQLHGGMGMTEELVVGHGYRRLLVVHALTGGAAEALARLTGEF